MILMSKLKLSIFDTNTLKGIALMLLLFHHIFYVNEGNFSDITIGHTEMINTVAVNFCKLCVSLFVFLSAYGLTVSTDSRGGEA